MTGTAISGHTRTELLAALAEARSRTLLLLSTLGDDDLRRQHDPLMSPIVWDLGHIAHFEELWLTRNLDGPIEFSEMPGLFNPFEHPRRVRGRLTLPGLAECTDMMREIRERVLARFDEVDLDDDHPLVRDGYVYRMVLQHEYQHDETILQTLQLKQGAPYAPPVRRALPAGSDGFVRGRMVRFPGGEVEIGTHDRTAAYDNERPAHRVTLRPFWIDSTPVTNGAYLEFLADGGYERRELWSAAGWAWREETGAVAPRYWYPSHGEWYVRTMDRHGLVDPDRPVCHVSYHEAEAYAGYRGTRLPDEYEWEAAAAWDPATGRSLAYPWGDEPATPEHANLDQLAFDTAPVGAFARNVSPIGCYGMIGDVWEWTSSDFHGYPGFEAFPYPEYSEAFFGSEYKVLRGGSWATRPGAVRNSFRNWDYPVRRQIFSGFRCARDE
jgi:iron(II)-dependent oxidoreductase